ncbi:hypothetical protein DFH27DRAFT_578633 [Peziza echinospora]|nr:hypothetical protein DFH27DRAFT_578633 [Peziza echinospora]
MSRDRKSYSSSTPLYELHTFIFPSSSQQRQKSPTTSPPASSVSRYCFPISYSVADEFLYPTATTKYNPLDKSTTNNKNLTTSTNSDPAHVNDWPTYLTRQPTWVVALLGDFIERMSRLGWLVAGLKFIDEAEEREVERKRKRELEREWEELGLLGAGGLSSDGDHEMPGRTVYYGGVFYGCWYGSDHGRGRGRGRRESWPPSDGSEEEGEGEWYARGKGYVGGDVIVGDRRRGEIKCQIVMMRDE